MTKPTCSSEEYSLSYQRGCRTASNCLRLVRNERGTILQLSTFGDPDLYRQDVETLILLLQELLPEIDPP